MTFGAIKQAVYDLLGLTGETTMVERLVNSGKDMLVQRYKWPWLEASANQLWTTSQRAYTMSTDVGHIIGLYTSTGTPLDGEVDRKTYDELYRADTSTAANPEVWIEEGATSTGAINIHVWKTPSGNSTGTVRYIKRVPDVSTDGSSFQQIPVTHHFCIAEYAAALFREWEGETEKATMIMARANSHAADLAGDVGRESMQEQT